MREAGSVWLIAGPTTSGKSALAIALARRVGGTIINADSMQVYRELRVLTARPTLEEEAQVPHVLYGVRAAAEPGSVAWWRGEALAAMEEVRAEGRVPILCGGTGMYFAALTGGLAEVPEIPAEARAEARILLEELGPAGLHGRLAEVDPETAGRLRPGDAQRVARAWEVWRATGVGLAAWWWGADGAMGELRLLRRSAPPDDRKDGLRDGWRFRGILLDPPREELRAAIAARFAAMLEQGAVEEVRGLMGLGLDPSLPAMRAHGVRELAGYLRGEISSVEATRRMLRATGQYTRRQATWFRHHALGDASFTIRARWTSKTQFSDQNMAALCGFIDSCG